MNNTYLFKLLCSPHISEKVTLLNKINNTIVFKVIITATKKEIKVAIEKLFKVKVKSVNIIIVKGKIKQKGRRKNFKKAYIIIEKDQNINFVGGAE
jgi:large subunit ribosomal protein L23